MPVGLDAFVDDSDQDYDSQGEESEQHNAMNGNVKKPESLRIVPLPVIEQVTKWFVNFSP